LRMRFMCANRISTFLRSRRDCRNASVSANARTWSRTSLKALAQINGRAILTTRDGFSTRLYVSGLSPEDAAQAAAREYDGTHRPDWAKRLTR
jgi:hypothetical protein